jgi:hypothetical protein
MLSVIDEFTHECLAIRVDRKLKAIDVIDVLSDLSSCAACRGTSAPTTAPSSSPKRCSNGSSRSALRPPTRGRSAIPVR